MIFDALNKMFYVLESKMYRRIICSKFCSLKVDSLLIFNVDCKKGFCEMRLQSMFKKNFASKSEIVFEYEVVM
jgi:hypothetical protein